MKSLKHILAAGLLVFRFISGTSQEAIELTVQAPKVVTVGEVFRLSYSINAKADGFNGPKIEGFLFNGPMLSTSMSTQIINNQVTQSVSYTYNYTLQATTEGVFSLQPATATFKGKTYTSGAVKIEVLKAGAGNQGQPGQSGQKPAASDGIGPEDLFVRIEVDRNTVYKGEQIQAVIRIYSRVNLARFGEIKMPSYGGFWNQEVPTPEQVSLERTNLNGKLYNVGVLRRAILVPQQTGKIVIDPFQIECFVNVPGRRQRSPFDDFFGESMFGSYETLAKKISSSPVEIQVKPFPSPEPASFTGAVGQYTVTAGIDKNSVKTNEAVTLKVTVRGKGNVKLIDLPPFKFPGDLEVYDPKIADQAETGSGGISGTKTFEYLIVPRHAGVFEIPSWTFTWFDPASGKYSDYTAPAMVLNVEKDPNNNETTLISAPGKEDIRVIGQDIRFIKTGIKGFQKVGNGFFGTAIFWFLLILVVLIALLFLGYLRYRFKNMDDREGFRFRKAIAVARKHLAASKSSLEAGKPDLFLEALLKGLWGYLGDKFNLQQSELTREAIEIHLDSQDSDKEITRSLIKVLDTAEYLRYAPGTGNADFKSLLDETEQIIIRIEKSFRR